MSHERAVGVCWRPLALIVLIMALSGGCEEEPDRRDSVMPSQETGAAEHNTGDVTPMTDVSATPATRPTQVPSLGTQTTQPEAAAATTQPAGQ